MTTRLKAPRTVQEWAADYLRRGFEVLPLIPGTKKSDNEKWMSMTFAPEDFKEGDNLGIRSVKGLTIIDEDCPEAVACAETFLPPTGAVFGRASKPRSKRLYRSSFDKIIAFKDTESKQTLIEIRVNHQDMAPPSVHPDGEPLEWDGGFGEPSTVDGPVLLRAVRLVATTSLISRYYNPPGARHDWTLALSGFLRNLGLTFEECLKVLQASAAWARDSKVNDREIEVRSTYNRPDDDPLKGAKELRETMETGKTFLSSLNKIWGSSSSAFLYDAKGEKILANSQENIRRALVRLDVDASFDAFAQQPLVKYNGYQGPLNDRMATHIWLQIDERYHFRPTKEFYLDVFVDHSGKHEIHPVRSYLEKLEWDKTPRIDEWLIRSAKAANAPFTRAVSALFFLAAVRRVMKPGCKFDEILVLESGQQGLQKSTALRLLCPDERWFSDDLPLNVDTQEVIERTLGKWIIEASDLSGMSPAKIEHLKAMLSRQVDGPVRMAYGRIATEQKRQFVIVGTTNSYNYLSDITGNRRFFPVRVEQFDLGYIRENRDQLWAEAVVREKAGESIRLDPNLYGFAAMQQERRRTVDPWESVLESAFPEEYHRLAPKDIWGALGLSVKDQTPGASKRVAAIMQLHGFRSMTVMDDKMKRVRGWGRGSKLLESFTDNDEGKDV